MCLMLPERKAFWFGETQTQYERGDAPERSEEPYANAIDDGETQFTLKAEVFPF